MNNKQIKVILECLKGLIVMKKINPNKNLKFLTMVWQYMTQKNGISCIQR